MMVRRQGPFPAEQVLTWADQLLDALDYLHTQDPQIVHRDIKPQNLKLTSRGQIILLDFGLAKGQSGEVSRITTAASIFGYTPNYAPLEQIQGLGTDSRSDLYSLAATIYHLLTATKPPDALTRAAALVNGQPDPLLLATDLNPAVAAEVSKVLEQAMAQNRDQRFASASEMRKALHRTEQTSTVINRGEAQTVLRPPVAATIASETTRLIDRQPTVATGETTVVRPLSSGSRRRVLPWVLSSGALAVVAACVLGFYVTRKPNGAVVQLDSATQKPSPIASPVATERIVDSGQNRNAIPAPEPRPTAAQAKTPRRVETPTPQPRKQSTSEPAPATPSSGSEHEAERPENPPEVPMDPTTTPSRSNGPGRNKMRPKGAPSVQVMPGGVVIRRFPDGSQVISTPDGSRVYIGPDGRRQVLNPPQNRRRPSTP